MLDINALKERDVSVMVWGVVVESLGSGPDSLC